MLRNLAENDVLFALLYLLAVVGFALAAAIIAARPAAAAWGLAIAAGARILRILSYGIGDLRSLLLVLPLAGAAALALAAVGAFGRACGAAWGPPALAPGFGIEAAHFRVVILALSPSFPGVLTPLAGVIGGSLAPIGATKETA